MRSPASAFAWELGRRHRWGLLAVVVYLTVLAVARWAVLRSGGVTTTDDVHTFAFSVVVPGSIAFMYVLSVFSFGLSGDLAARESMYPTRLFTLPVTNAALVGWPMLWGGLTMAALWAVTRWFGVWPETFDPPLVWPGLLAVVILAWTQALTWMPYALPGLRAVVAVALMCVIDAVVFPAVYFEASEPVMIGLLLPFLPLAYVTARFAVAGARRGELPDWRSAFSGLARVVGPRASGADFRSAHRAQVWFEWRRFGRSLPALVAIVVPFELALLFAFSEAPRLVGLTVVAVLATPTFLAVFVAVTVARASRGGRDPGGMAPFAATRPVTNASFVAAKLVAAAWSAVATWLLVLVLLPAGLVLSGTSTLVVDWLAGAHDFLGPPRAVVVAILVAVGLVASTWKGLVQSLFVGLSGRPWLVKGSVVVALSALAIAVPVLEWVVRRQLVLFAVKNVLPWLFAAVATLEVLALGWFAVRLRTEAVVNDRSLVAAAAGWSGAVFALYGVLAWILPTYLIPSHVLAFAAIVAVPAVRLASAPLALARNRHR